jgi:hypothetical protein
LGFRLLRVGFGLRCWVSGLGFGIQGLGLKVQGSGLAHCGSCSLDARGKLGKVVAEEMLCGRRVRGSELKIWGQGLGLSVYGSRFRD